MRWERLFQDFEDQLDRETDAELEDMARDEERLRIAKLSLSDRLRSLGGATDSSREGHAASAGIVARIGGIDAECTISRVGRDWVLADITSPRIVAGSAIIPIGAIGHIRLQNDAAVTRSLTPSRVAGAPRLANDIGMTFVLRDLCRRRRAVTIICRGEEVSGTIDRVGRDHVDVAVHSVGTSRADVTHIQTAVIPLTRVEIVLLP